MKFLLLNDNPVVNKLVTLSAQKSGDELVSIDGTDDIDAGNYDLLIVDSASFDSDAMQALKQKISYRRAMYMGQRGEEVPDGFDTVLNKPFLPTDLVEIFTSMPKGEEGAFVGDDSGAGAAMQEVGELESAEAFALDEMPDENADLDELEEIFLDEGDEVVLSGDTTDEAETVDLDDVEEPGESVFDSEDLQEVQALLDDTEDEEILADKLPEAAIGLNEASIDEVNAVLEELGDEILEDSEEPEAEELSEEELEGLEEEPEAAAETAEAEEEFDLSDIEGLEEEELTEEALAEEPEAAAETAEEEEEFDLSDIEGLEEELGGVSDESLEDIGEQIERAVSDLSEEDLAAEVDEETLLEIASGVDGDDVTAAGAGDFDEFDALDELDLKIAVGEADEREKAAVQVVGGEFASLGAEALQEAMEMSHEEAALSCGEDEPFIDEGLAGEKKTPQEGIEALQSLIKALSNEDVARSLKEMNISINISFGEKE